MVNNDSLKLQKTVNIAGFYLPKKGDNLDDTQTKEDSDTVEKTTIEEEEEKEEKAKIEENEDENNNELENGKF